MSEACVVCKEEPVDDSNSSHCSFCQQRYHLNQRSDGDAKDCGDVWIGEASMALEFACRNCIDEGRTQPQAAGS